MLLYHGTTEAVARQALTEGLLPRSLSGAEGHWEDHPSSPEHVYLTETYAGYFAFSACGLTERWGIVEVDLDRVPLFSLCPDEDFLEQCSRGQDWPDDEVFAGIRAAQGIEERTAWFRQNLHRFGHLWLPSIDMLGNCAVEGGVPAEAVTRVALFDPSSNPSVAIACTDPCIVPMNHQICGDKYRALTSWLMGDAVDPGALVGWGWEHYPPEQQADIARMYNTTHGIEVLTGDAGRSLREARA